LPQSEYLKVSDAPLVALGLLKDGRLSIKYWMRGMSDIKDIHFSSETNEDSKIGFFFLSSDNKNTGLELVHSQAYTILEVSK